MRYNSTGNQLLSSHPRAQSARVTSTEVTKQAVEVVRRSRAVLNHLRQIGVLGDEEHRAVLKRLLEVAQSLRDLNSRERIVVASRRARKESISLREGRRYPPRTRLVPNFVLRERLRNSANGVFDFVDTMAEGLKRLRYANYVSDDKYVKYRALVELLPKPRVEILELLEAHGDA